MACAPSKLVRQISTQSKQILTESETTKSQQSVFEAKMCSTTVNCQLNEPLFSANDIAQTSVEQILEDTVIEKGKEEVIKTSEGLTDATSS